MPATSQDYDFPAPPEDFLTYPEHKVVALMDDPESVRAAMDDLDQAGFGSGKINVMSGPDGVAKLDVTGRRHGLRGRIHRLVEHLGDEHEWLELQSAHIADGGYWIAVSTDEQTKSQVADILTQHGAHDAAYFAVAHWETL